MKPLISLIILIPTVACSASNQAHLARQQNPSGVNNVASTSESQSTPSTEPPIPQDSPIRKIDFYNFTFNWYPAWADAPATGRKIILKNGEMNLDFAYGKEPREFFLTEGRVKYGDLTSDGHEEAVVVLGIITSGTARPGIVFVYTVLNDRPKRLWVYETGSRADYGYHNTSIKDGLLIIERYKPVLVEHQGRTISMSLSDTYIRDHYKWTGARFLKVRTDEVAAEPDDSAPWVRRS